MKVIKVSSTQDREPQEDPQPIPEGADLKLMEPGLSAPCLVNSRPDGSLIVAFHVDLFQARRLRLKAGTMHLDKFIWENVLQRAIDSMVY